MGKTYEKLCKNPLGLRTVTIPKGQRTFTDEDVEKGGKVAEQMLQLALKAGLCKELNEVEVEELQASLENKDAVIVEKDAELTKAQEEIIKLKTQLVDGYGDMDEEELAKEFNKDELLFIAADLLKLDVKSNSKEATICKAIVAARG